MLTRADTMWPLREPPGIADDARGSFTFEVTLLGSVVVDGIANCIGGQIDSLEIGSADITAGFGRRASHADPLAAAIGTAVLQQLTSDDYYIDRARDCCRE